MTYSIVARDPVTGAFGVAAATGGPCVGALVPYAARYGAIATQGDTNPYYGHDGMKMLKDGVPADEVVRTLVDADPGSAQRQFIAIGGRSAPAMFSGSGVEDYSGTLAGNDFAVAGNMLANGNVLVSMARVFEAGAATFADRVFNALRAGEMAGGDKRGSKSAVLLIFSGKEYADFNCRVDFSSEPVADLSELVELTRTGGYARFLAGRPGAFTAKG